MLKLDLADVARGGVRVHEEVPADDPAWRDADVTLLEPLTVDLDARPVDDGVLVRGTLGTVLDMECRRCLAPVRREVDAAVELLFEPLEDVEAAELEGELYPLPDRGTILDLIGPIREELLLNVPMYALCREECRGLCPRCGTNLNEAECRCVPEVEAGPWDALKTIKFD